MKKLWLYIITIILFMSVNQFSGQSLAADDSTSNGGWDDMIKFDQSWKTNHEAVTDEEFEKVMKQYEKKKKPKKYEFEADESRDSLNDMSILNDISDHSPTILFPLNVRTYEGEYIPAGYYRLNYFEKNKNHYLLLSQGRTVYARIKMEPTEENFESETIQFAELRDNDSESMKLIYGNIDLNLEQKLYIMK